jgi:hypothetical protein
LEKVVDDDCLAEIERLSVFHQSWPENLTKSFDLVIQNELIHKRFTFTMKTNVAEIAIVGKGDCMRK